MKQNNYFVGCDDNIIKKNTYYNQYNMCFSNNKTVMKQRGSQRYDLMDFIEGRLDVQNYINSDLEFKAQIIRSNIIIRERLWGVDCIKMKDHITHC